MALVLKVARQPCLRHGRGGRVRVVAPLSALLPVRDGAEQTQKMAGPRGGGGDGGGGDCAADVASVINGVVPQVTR